jgi:Rieske Fe-S protein
MDRRRFNTLCSGLLAGAASLHARGGDRITPYPRTQLVYDDETPVALPSLERGVAHIFGYPYRTTPCFLVRLNQASPARGSWPGGVDHDQSVVAFSAICSHKMSHPAKPISHISYRARAVTFYDASGQKQTRDDLISCCSERSVYDPVAGAQVLAGPAPAPLAAIVLEVDDDKNLWATGSIGPDQYEQFLEKFGFRLAMEHGVTDVRERSGDKCTVVRAEEYSAQQVLC